MKVPLFLALSLSAFSVGLTAQESFDPDTQDSGYYHFLGAEILVQYRKIAAPIISTDKKGVYVDIGKKKPKRFPWHTICLGRTTIGVSNRFVDITDMDYKFFYQNASFREKEAYDKIRAKARETSIHITQIRASQGGSGSVQDAIDMLETQYAEFAADLEELIENDDLKIAGHADSIDLKMTLTPTSDIRDAYCAAMVDYSEVSGKRRVVYKLNRLGDLLKDIPETTSFTMLLGEGDFRQSRFELFLFSGDGSPIATNRSRGLRMLSVAEFEELIK